MVMKFSKTRLYVPELNNLSYNNQSGVISGCVVTEQSPLALGVTVSSGSLLFNNSIVSVTTQNVSITTPDPLYKRWDLVLVDSSGIVSVLAGTPATLHKTPTYDPDVYYCIAMIEVRAGASSVVNSDLRDTTIKTNSTTGIANFKLNTTVPGSSPYEIIVNHGLNDISPIIQVYDNNNEMIDVQRVLLSDNNTAVLTFGSAHTGVNVKIVVIGGQFSGGTGDGNFLPTVDNSFNIGSASYRWQDMYMSGSLFIGILTSDPGSLSKGQIWFNDTDKQLKMYNGTSIIILG